MCSASEETTFVPVFVLVAEQRCSKASGEVHLILLSQCRFVACHCADQAFPRAVAQWLEQGTHNPSVVGSIPAGPTMLLFCSWQGERVLVCRRALFSKSRDFRRSSIASVEQELD